MKLLIGCVLAGDGKNYALSYYEHMAQNLLGDQDHMVFVDYPGRTNLPEYVVSEMRGSFWATEMVYYAKMLAMTKYALTLDYDAVMWVGVDAFFDSRHDFDELVALAEKHPIVGGLVCGRNRPDYPVCRLWVDGTREQEEIDWADVHLGDVIPVKGYIGSDATIISREVLGYMNVFMQGYKHWHLYKDECNLSTGALGPEEFFMWRACQHGYVPQCHTGVRLHHAHENMTTARYPNQSGRLEELWTALKS